MTSSSGSSVRAALRGYLAGRVSPELAAVAVAEAYYGGPATDRQALRPVLEVIDRAAPGVVELARTAEGAGFAVRPAGRPFPASGEAAFRSAAEAALATTWGSLPDAAPRGPAHEPVGMLARLMAAVRRLFSAGS